MVLVNGGHDVKSWGWPLCTRTSYRYLESYELMPRIIKFLSKVSPIFSGGVDKPKMEASFLNPVVDMKMGCGYVTAIDSHNNVLSWGDNYAG